MSRKRFDAERARDLIAAYRASLTDVCADMCHADRELADRNLILHTELRGMARRIEHLRARVTVLEHENNQLRLERNQAA